MIYAIWLLLILVEIARNWAIITVKKRRPRYWWSNVMRIAVGLIFWLLVGVVVDLPPTRFYALPVMMVLSFWWIFDYGLNLVRKQKPFYYLNPKGSWLDQMQCKYPDALPWFFWKLLLMTGGITLFEVGWSAVTQYVPETWKMASSLMHW